MPSPFPGMDPYLELPTWWSDFHWRFVNYWCEAIADLLPSGYEASLGKRVYPAEHDPDARNLGYPDLAVTRGNVEVSQAGAAKATATLEPVTIPLTVLDGPRESYVEILHQPDRTLVAVLELLSPANKEYPGRTVYLAKRTAIQRQEVHLVELDLLLGGPRLPMDRQLPPGEYYYFLSRGDQRPNCQVYSWTLERPLPTLPVPLRPPDGELMIDLGGVFNTAYDRGRFRRRIDYQGPPPSAVDDKKKLWVQQVLADQATSGESG